LLEFFAIFGKVLNLVYFTGIISSSDYVNVERDYEKNIRKSSD